MGSEQESCRRTTRASKKRPYASVTTPASQSLQVPATKKRVVLGDLTNSPSLDSTQIPSDCETKRPKRGLKKKNGGTLEPESLPNTDEPQKLASPVYDHLHSMEMEESRRPLPNYMVKIQNDVTANMREILVDWLVEVAEQYKLVSDTLFLTVSYIDRFLSSHALSRNKLQLLGVSCMLVASKYEEISPPHVEDFCYVTDNSYTKEEVLTMERHVLEFLNFELGSPTTKTFLRIFTRVAQEDYSSPNLQFEFLGCYLAELSLLDYGYARFLPSMIAASATFLSRFTLQPNVHPWSSVLQSYSGYRPSDLKECIRVLHGLQLSSRASSRAVRDKYMQHKVLIFFQRMIVKLLLIPRVFSFSVLILFQRLIVELLLIPKVFSFSQNAEPPPRNIPLHRSPPFDLRSAIREMLDVPGVESVVWTPKISSFNSRISAGSDPSS